jgi:nicotinamidase-related amidase
VRDACDLGYLVTLVEDACTTVTPELHKGTISSLSGRYASVMSTAEVIELFEKVVDLDQVSIAAGI